MDWNALVAASDHRPFPVPERRWAMTMSWERLLFAHYRVDPSALRALVPESLELDLFDGEAWVGVVPFDMRRVGPPGLNWVPWLSHFPELNVRVYVVRDGLPGVFFFSLDAANWVAVVAARLGFSLPYFWAKMRCRAEGEAVAFESARLVGPQARFRASYQPSGEVFRAEAGSLEHFLTERYCLYATNRRGALFRGHVHHLPWPLQPAEAEIEESSMLDWIGLRTLDREPPLLHYARRVDVVAWINERVDDAKRG